MTNDPNQRIGSDPGIRILLDVFSGADGGVAFVTFANFINRMRRMAAEGDAVSAKILEIHDEYVKLVTTVTGLEDGRFGL
jgi:hypothetical protein